MIIYCFRKFYNILQNLIMPCVYRWSNQDTNDPALMMDIRLIQVSSIKQNAANSSCLIVLSRSNALFLPCIFLGTSC